jgi:hypothetical protein
MTDWPDWPLSEVAAGDAETIAELVRYADVSRTRSYVPADCLGQWPNYETGRRRADNLYEALRAHRILYADEPWNPAGSGQRIRGPNEAMQSPATCLDLALVFAGMAMAADLRPLLGVRFGTVPHALVILDVNAPLSGREDEPTAPDGFTMHPGRPGVWKAGTGEGPGADVFGVQRNWRIVDVFLAARHRQVTGAWEAEGQPYADAVLEADELLKYAGPDHRWTLVDVDFVRADHVRNGRRLHTPPVGRSIPAIHGYLPALPAFTDYPSRREFLGELHDVVDAAKPHAVLVLQGDSGLGKSMLAHRLARAADNGCGWFLNATDAKILTTSLAQAERQEKSERGELIGGEVAATGEKPDPGDDRALASAALSRLREAERPWVVVLDNCDSGPDTPGLVELVPQPHQPGQFVIITTKHPDWLEHARQHGWQPCRLPRLEEGDLDELSLPRGLDDAVAGRPLIAQALAALRGNGVDLPDTAADDGPDLVWDLLRASHRTTRDVIALAQLLAWAPPEPANVPSLLKAAGLDEASTAVAVLEAFRFVIPSVAQTSDRSRAIQMHRLFAAAVRESAWNDDPAAAARAIDRLLTTEEGEGFFINAADTTALIRLESDAKTEEPGEVAKAVGFLTDGRRDGLLWHGLGHVRERLGPVSASAAPFAEAVRRLDASAYPFPAAECLIGQARVVYQKGPAANEELVPAREMVENGRRILDPLTDTESLQLREQGNALAWLITQRIAGREKDPARREELLAEVRENLWLSYERRRRIIRPGSNPAEKSPPEPEDGLGSERAYYNLAGVNIQLAKVHHELDMIDQVEEDLQQAADVYTAVRMLRELRYGGRAHPHLASCVHGQALVAYFRAVLLGEIGELADSFRFAGEAMEQRRKVVSGLAGPGSRAVLVDPDMQKSMEFIMKVSAVGVLDRHGNVDDGAAAVIRICEEAQQEWAGRPVS